MAKVRECRVLGIKWDVARAGPFVVLQVSGAEGVFVVGVSRGTAHSIKAALDAEYKGTYADRPLEHDVAIALAEAGGVRVKRAVIDRLTEARILGATLVVQSSHDGRRTKGLDVRPSDAIAIALRAGAPITIAEEVSRRVIFRVLEELPFREAEPVDLVE